MGLAAIARARAAFAETDLRARLGKYHNDPVDTFRGWSDAWLDRDFRDWSVADVIEDLQVPVLALQGEDDEYGTRAQIEVISKRASVSTETHLLPECRHSPHLSPRIHRIP